MSAIQSSLNGQATATDDNTKTASATNNRDASKLPVSSPEEAPASTFKLGDFQIDDPNARPMKILIIGTGFSGIAAGIRFRQRIPGVEMVIYEKSEAVGGTWFSNRYPGLACDIPSHCYQYTFTNKTDWSSFYAPGPEILAYLNSVVSQYDLDPYIKLRHEMVGAWYDEATGKWRIRVRRPRSRPHTSAGHGQSTDGASEGEHVRSNSEEWEEFEDTGDLLFTGIGGLSRWDWPEIEGLKNFKGTLVHSAQWDVGSGSSEGKEARGIGLTEPEKKLNNGWEEGVKDWKGKKIAVIGVGSSAIQIVPALQPKVAKLYNYVRGKTWLAVPFGSDRMAGLLGRNTEEQNYAFSEEEKQSFQDPAYYKQFRHALEEDLNSSHQAILRGTPMQMGAREVFKANMLKRLAKKPWIADHLVPDFGVACRRLTPGPGYLEALCEDNVDFIPTHIKRVTEAGIETVDGKHQDLDVIICATGYDTSFKFPFPIVGRNGIDIRSKWSPYPKTYLATCVDGFPNWFFSLGPNSAVGSGSLLALIEKQVDYAVQVAMKMKRERLKSVEAKREAVEDYDEYIEQYFPTTVYSEKCRSWYKMGKEEGRVVGLWPGSTLQALRVLQCPRWEDFDYERIDDDKTKNRFYYLGDGMTFPEKTGTGSRALVSWIRHTLSLTGNIIFSGAWYLDDDHINIPPGMPS
ncbi:hypothetical protein PHLCEN_2v13485 [Hermanssonia centrifuga]|uniref:FAD/NAD(P)-binding domain-containing protein n=1 Tax=Hermanssonia centrifuga TaxID=98765 RepID=A0A2R6NE39_9APHY|nr:hypothetical protein PHLCEN_2v13485 [Hermanssonia centrifuga]